MSTILLRRARGRGTSLLIALLLAANSFVFDAPAAHATDVGGVISANTTWTLVNSPYIVTSNILVNAGVRLTIEPGVTVKFNAGKSMQIDGELIARGTSASRIIFTANGGGTPGAWGYLLFADSSADATFDGNGAYVSGSILQYAVVEHGGSAAANNNAAVRMESAAPYLEHVAIRNSGSAGVAAYGGPGLRLIHSVISSNAGAGVRLENNAAAQVIGSAIEANGAGGVIIVGGNALLRENRIEGNSGTGISAVDTTASIQHNTVTSNMGAYDGGGIYAGTWPYAVVNILDNTIVGNVASHAGGGIAGGRVISGNTIRGNRAALGGGIAWEGIISEFSGQAIASNVIQGNQATQTGGGVYAPGGQTITANLVISNTAEAAGGILCGLGTVHFNVIAENTAASGPGGVQGGEALYVTYLRNNTFVRNVAGSGVANFVYDGEILRNTFADNRVAAGPETYSLRVQGHPIVHDNNFHQEATAYRLDVATPQGNGDLDALSNWWGATDPGWIAARVHDGTDDPLLATALYTPALSSPSINPPLAPPADVALTALAGTATITWSPNAEADTAGYKVYWDTDAGYPYANSVDVGRVAGYTLNGLGAPRTYIAVTAYSTAHDGIDDWTDGDESWFSEEVVADFGPPTYPLTVTLHGGGAGAVASSPPGIACGGDCGERYLQGTSVVLTATADADNLFTGWGGACTGAAPTCSLVMNAARAVTATFDLPVPVPEVTGIAQADAEATLAGAGLATGAVTTQPDEFVPAGYVLSQDPPPGMYVAPGTAVSLVISSGPAPVNVPNVVGSPQAQAEAALTGAGLAVGTVTTQPSASVPAGRVISQNPAAGTSVAPGTAVNLVVSSGPPPAGGDAYEPDDTCAAARTITATVQHRTFHQAGDADWAHFSAEARSQYVIETSAVGSQADTVLALFDACGANTPLASDDYGASARIVWTAQQTGTYYVRVTNHDPTRYGSAATYDLAVRLQPPLAPAVIIVGGHDDARRLQTNIDNVTDRAYRAFQAGGLSDDRIYYLSPDAQPGRDAVSTSANLEQAIRVWAAGKVGPGVPLYLYMMDHGGKDTFIINGSRDVITATQLDGWLDDLQQRTGVAKINVIVEACRSGSFIDEATRISQPGRVVIASTSATQNAYASPLGAYFSDAFLTALEDSQSLCSSFELARRAVAATGLAQTPWLDDNGNGVANDPTDGDIACGRGLAALFGERPPLIEGVSAPALVSGSEATLRARVQDDVGVAKVWALVYAPSFVEPPAGDTTVKLDLPEFELTDANGDREYEGTYEGFTEKGVYRLVVYAEDAAGFQALPQELTVEAADQQGGARLWLPVIVR